MPRSSPIGDVVVVGSSVAGTTLVETLRSEGYDGRITLVGAETTPAYHRPALSKGLLSGKEQLDDILLLPLRCEVDVRLGAVARAVDRERRTVRLDDGVELRFDALAITTGARARRLADIGAAEPQTSELTVRDLADVRRLSDSLTTSHSVVIVGAGLLGMELASACVDRGMAVTVVDRQQPLMAQWGPHISELVTEEARRRGVKVVVDREGAQLRGRDHPVVRLGDRVFEGDLVISAIGCVPNTGWLEGLGISADLGVPVDAWGRLDERIVAAGDVAAFPHEGGRHRRTPVWNSALEQGRVAARALLHGDASAPLRSAGYVWTEVFGMTIRACGRLPASGRPIVVERSDTGGALLQWHDQHGPTTAVALDFRAPIGRLRALAEPSAIAI